MPYKAGNSQVPIHCFEEANEMESKPNIFQDLRFAINSHSKFSVEDNKLVNLIYDHGGTLNRNVTSDVKRKHN